jgi:hypothetical protein
VAANTTTTFQVAFATTGFIDDPNFSPNNQQFTAAVYATMARIAVSVPATPAEIAAGVPIVQPSYLPGVPDRYQVNVKQGTTDMVNGWQFALNSNKEVNAVPGELYAVTSTGLVDRNGASIGLNVPSGVQVNGHGATVRYIGAATVGAVFSNVTGELSRTQIYNIVVDSNGLSSGVVLYNGTDCDIGPFVTSLSPNGPVSIGLGHRATNETIAHGRNRITTCRVKDAGFISIQCAHQVLGLSIDQNFIENSTDNGIDVEGNIPVLNVTITSITQANPAVVTYNYVGTQPLEVGLEVRHSGVIGMPQINGLTGTISAVGGVSGAFTYTLGGVGGSVPHFGLIDSSGFDVRISGGIGTIGGAVRRLNVTRNKVNGCTGDCAYFIESCGNFLFDDNEAENVTSSGGFGLRINQITTQAVNGVITNNRFNNIPNGYGMDINGSGKVRIADNAFRTMINSVRFQNGALFVSMGVNTHEDITGTTLFYYYPTTGSQGALVWSSFEAQHYFGAAVAGIPFTASPIDNTSNPNTLLNGQNRTLFASPAPTKYLQSGAQAVAGTAAPGGAVITALQMEYYDGANGTLIDLTGGGVYSTFAAGETKVKPSVLGSAYTPGSYLWIQGVTPTLYKVQGTSAGTATIRQANYPGTATAAPTGTTMALTGAFAGLTGTYTTFFTDTETRGVSYINGVSTGLWAGTLTGAPGVALLIMDVGGNFTGNLTGSHPAWEYYPTYQTEVGN